MRRRGLAGRAPPLFLHRPLQDPQRFVKTLEKFRKIVGKKDHRLPIKPAGVPVFTFHNIEVQVPQTVFLYIEKIGPVL
jgi:hypothetical protein